MENRTHRLLLQLKMLSDASRMRLLALCRHGECSVSELTQVLGLSQPRVSQHLKQLCDAGLLRRFRDGKRVFYRVSARGDTTHRGLLALIPDEDSQLVDDAARLHALRGARIGPLEPGQRDLAADRAIHRAILEQTVTAPLGDLLDVGCGRGKMLKLLASRANRAVGVDIDADARQVARAELMLAGIPNCSLRQGDMYRLPFADHEFDTVILDDVLAGAERPVEALIEAKRQLRPGGRLFVLLSVHDTPVPELQRAVAQWSSLAGLRLSQARLAPKQDPVWMLSVATAYDRQSEAA